MIPRLLALFAATLAVAALLALMLWLQERALRRREFHGWLRALPPLGYIGLLIVWFGIGDTSKIWLLFLAAFPPIAVATMQGVQGVQVSRVNAARSLGATRWQVMRHVTIPSALPEVIGGIRIATGFTWTTVVAAELNNGIPGIGGLA